MSKNKGVLTLLIVLVLCSCVSRGDKLSPSGALDIEKRAETHYVNANLQLAEIEYRKLLKLVPRYAKGWFKLGNIYLRSNQLNAAVFHYQKALQFDPKMAKAWHNLSLARVHQAVAVLVKGQDAVDKNQTAKIDFLLAKLLLLQKSN